MLEEFMTQFEYQLQIGLMALIAVMAALTWRAHRQVSKLSATSAGMQESLGTLEESTSIVEVLSTAMANTRLETATDEITASTSETEKTLRSNLEEYRLAAGSTSAYRDNLQRMDMAPAADVEPILEAFSDGAEAVSTDGRILYANHALADFTSISPGDTLQEVLDRCQMRTFGGISLDIEDMPESRVLTGEKIESILVCVCARVGATTT